MALFNMPMATLTDLEPPVIEGTTLGTSTEIYENIALDSFIARIQTDSPVASFTITNGNTTGAFKIAPNGDITTENVINYEVTPSFTLEIVATDHVGRDSQPFTFTVNVLDLDENAPVVTLDNSRANLTQINEFVTTDTLVATFNVVDNDTGGAVATTSTSSLAREPVPYVEINGARIRASTIMSVAPNADTSLTGNPSAENFYVVWDYQSTTNGQAKIYAYPNVALAGGVDVDTDVTLTIGVADEAGNYGYATYTITVNDWPDPSIFQPVQLRTPLNTFTLQENTPQASGKLADYHARGTSPIQWSVHGDDADKLTMNEHGELFLNDPLDYETQSYYTFTVRATNYLYGPDGEIDQTYFDEEPCELTVIDDTTDNPLIVTGPSTVTPNENVSTSTVIATYSATGHTPITFALSGTDAADFTIDTTGRVRFRNVPDFENPADGNRDNTYSFNVVATNPRETITKPVTVSVSDVDDAIITFWYANGTLARPRSFSEGEQYFFFGFSGQRTNTLDRPGIYRFQVSQDCEAYVSVLGAGQNNAASGYTYGDVSLQAGQNYYFVVGSQGVKSDHTNGYPAPHGGFGGGGAGGTNRRGASGRAFGDGGTATYAPSAQRATSGGSGLSGLFKGSISASGALLIAGGGGGTNGGGEAGYGGGLSGGAAPTKDGIRGGGGGTQTSNGSGGPNGLSGSVGYGGGGAAVRWGTDANDYNSGSGGGGGYRGGGGGGGGSKYGQSGTGGGGGSGYIKNTGEISNSHTRYNYRTGVGRVIIQRKAS